MTTIRHRGDGALILGDREHEIVVEASEVAALHQHLAAVVADRERRLRHLADSV